MPFGKKNNKKRVLTMKKRRFSFGRLLVQALIFTDKAGLLNTSIWDIACIL